MFCVQNAMRIATYSAVAAATLIVSGCSIGGLRPTIDPVDYVIGSQVSRAEVESWSLAGVNIIIPEEMEVWTDPDSRYPSKKYLIWWGDPPGDRKAQVRELMAQAIATGAVSELRGTTKVVLQLDMIEFHAMTPAARASELPFGVHEIKFDVTIVDSATGQILAIEKGVNADLQAFSGTAAIQSEEVGRGQKVRIQERVAQVVRSWLRSVQS
ncbi:MAG: DUF6778 family protein [Pikeienuella sp.]